MLGMKKSLSIGAHLNPKISSIPLMRNLANNPRKRLAFEENTLFPK
jgi:hypothetical protein